MIVSPPTGTVRRIGTQDMIKHDQVAVACFLDRLYVLTNSRRVSTDFRLWERHAYLHHLIP